jgi:hypothetical protein
LIAFVTTVSPASSARARATSIVVVPPVSPTVAPSGTSDAAAIPIRRFSACARAAL